MRSILICDAKDFAAQIYTDAGTVITINKEDSTYTIIRDRGRQSGMVVPYTDDLGELPDEVYMIIQRQRARPVHVYSEGC